MGTIVLVLACSAFICSSRRLQMEMQKGERASRNLQEVAYKSLTMLLALSPSSAIRRPHQLQQLPRQHSSDARFQVRMSDSSLIPASPTATRSNTSNRWPQIDSKSTDLTRWLDKKKPAYRKICENTIKQSGPNGYVRFARELESKGDLEGASVILGAVLLIFTQQLGPAHASTIQIKRELAMMLRHRGDMKRAEGLYREILQVRRETLGVSHLDTLKTMVDLAETMSRRGAFQAAVDVLQEVVRLKTDMLGENDRSTLSTRSRLARALVLIGDLEAAEKIQRENIQAQLRILQGSLGSATPHSYLWCLVDLGRTLRDRGDLQGAEETLEKAMKGFSKKWGRYHHKTIDVAGKFCDILRLQGKYKMAVDITRGLLEYSEKTYGEDHPETLWKKYRLALNLKDLNATEAEALLWDVLEARQRLLGPSHRTTLACKSRLAQLISKSGSFQVAENLLLEAVESGNRKFGPDSFELSNLKNNLAQVKRRKGDLSDAEKLFQEVVDTRTRVNGAAHADTLAARGNLAKCMLERGDEEIGEKMLQSVFMEAAKGLGKEHSATLYSAHDLAEYYLSKGRLQDAEKIFRQILDIRSRTCSSILDRLKAEQALAKTLKARGNLTGAKELQQEILAVYTRMFGPENSRGMQVKLNLTQAELDLAEKEYLEADVDKSGDLDAGEFEAFVKTLETEEELETTALFEEVDLDDSGDIDFHEFTFWYCATKWSKERLALALEAQGDLDCLEELHSENVKAARRTFGSSHPNTIAAKSVLAHSYKSRGKLGEAQKTQEDVVQAWSSTLGSDHPDTLRAKTELASIFRTQGDLFRARDLQREVLESSMRILGVGSEVTRRTEDSLSQILNDLKVAEGEYASADRDKSGNIDLEEFKLLVKKLGLGDEASAEALFRQADTDNSDDIDLREFVVWFSRDPIFEVGPAVQTRPNRS